MSYSPSTPITGAAQTGFTTPTYTISADVAPDVNGKQHAVTAIGGTQAGVTTHTVSSPFTLTFVRPKSLKALPQGASTTSLVKSIPRNTFKEITRKGVTPAAGYAPVIMNITTTIDVPAGAETYDAANVRAALSAHIGALSQVSAGIGDTCVNGVL